MHGTVWACAIAQGYCDPSETKGSWMLNLGFRVERGPFQVVVQDSTGILAVHVTRWQVRWRWKTSRVGAHQRQRELFRVRGILD